MGSSRFRGKVVREVCGIPLVSRVLRACLAAQRRHHVIIAMPDTDEKSELPKLIRREFEDNVIQVFGSEQNVYLRFQFAFNAFEKLLSHEDPKNGVVRVCADRPFLQPSAIDSLDHAQHSEDLLYNHQPPPACVGPVGLGAESMSRDLAREFFREGSSFQHSIEHVTVELYRDPSVQTKFVPPDWFQYLPENKRFDLDIPEQLSQSRSRSQSLSNASKFAFIPGNCEKNKENTRAKSPK